MKAIIIYKKWGYLSGVISNILLIMFQSIIFIENIVEWCIYLINNVSMMYIVKYVMRYNLLPIMF